MSNVKDFDAVGVNPQEQHAVVANTKTKLKAWRLQLDDVAGSRRQVVIDGLKDTKSCFTIDGAQLGFASGDQTTIFFSGIQREIRPSSRRISSCDVPSPC